MRAPRSRPDLTWPSYELALVPIPGANVLVVADFGQGDYREIPWQDQAGPTYVALE